MIKYLLRTRRKTSGCCGRKRDSVKYRVVEIEGETITRVSEPYLDLFKLAKAEGVWTGMLPKEFYPQIPTPKETPF